MIVKVGYNPNLVNDIKNIFRLVSTEDDISEFLKRLDKKKQSYYDRLVAFVDRIDFIEHLYHVKQEAIQKGFVINNTYEVNGIDCDIDSLRLYLVLSCIDMFANLRNYKPFEEWLPENCMDINDAVSFKENAITKADEYKNEFGISSNFKKAIRKSPSKNRLIDNLQVLDRCKFGSINNSTGCRFIHIETCSSSNNIDDIINFLARIRNKYTHEGCRVYYNSPELPSLIMIGVRVKNGALLNESRTALEVASGFDLVAELKEIAVQQCVIRLDIELKPHNMSFPK